MTSTRDLTETGREAPAETAELERLRAEVAAWRAAYERAELRALGFTNSAGEVAPLYTALDVGPLTAGSLGVPGVYPYARGIHPTGYRGRLWTMRQFAGFGSAED